MPTAEPIAEALRRRTVRLRATRLLVIPLRVILPPAIVAIRQTPRLLTGALRHRRHMARAAMGDLAEVAVATRVADTPAAARVAEVVQVAAGTPAEVRAAAVDLQAADTLAAARMAAVVQVAAATPVAVRVAAAVVARVVAPAAVVPEEVLRGDARS
jgi:hypothetical protein